MNDFVTILYFSGAFEV